MLSLSISRWLVRRAALRVGEVCPSHRCASGVAASAARWPMLSSLGAGGSDGHAVRFEITPCAMWDRRCGVHGMSEAWAGIGFAGIRALLLLRDSSMGSLGRVVQGEA